MSSNISYDEVFTYDHLFRSLLKCLKNVSWKGSVQSYSQLGIVNVYRLYTAMKDRQLPKVKNTKKFFITERGKTRSIVSIYVADRIVQRTLCDYALVPVLSRSLIYDNGACLTGKGTQFSRNRFNGFLVKAARKWKNNFYFLVFDFKDYFASIPHELCYQILDRAFEDKDIVNVAMQIIESYEPGKDKGLTLGSQVSQIMAVAAANRLDHWIKEKARAKFYIRHMDDGIVIAETKEELEALLGGIRKISEELGLNLHSRKTRIVRASKGVRFLKVLYRVTDTGKIVKRLPRRATAVQRRKLKKFKRFLKTGHMNMDDVYDSMQSWLTSTDKAMSYRTKKSMLSLYTELFGRQEAKRFKRKR